MAVDLSALSSNWKALQKTLQKEKKSSPKTDTHGTSKKRKSEHIGGADTLRKRQKVTSNKVGSIPQKSRKMGGSLSKAPPAAATTAKAAGTDVLANSTNIPTDGTTNGRMQIDEDGPLDVLRLNEPFTPNQGHYPPAKAAKHKYLAVDCEMVGVGPPPHDDSQLARVSITNFHGELLYDTYVLPVVPVTDYRTHVSGIAEEHLQPGFARPFKTVQADVAELLKGRILVGHAIHNDLSALILQHPKRDIRDTSRYPNYRAISGGRTPSLKKLAKEFLGLEIQSGEHSSVDDARVTMALFRREKEGFERETLRKFGPPKVVKEVEVDEEVEEAKKEKQRIKNQKRKKKKKRK